MKPLLPFVRQIIRYGWVLLLLTGFALSTSAQNTTPTIVPFFENSNSLYYSSETGRYIVRIPTPISLREQERIFSPAFFEFLQFAGPSLVCHDLAAKDYSAVWLVTYCDYPPELLIDLTPDEILDSAANAAVRFYGRDAGENRQHEEIIYDVMDMQFPGRAIQYAMDANDFDTNAFNAIDAVGKPYTETLQARIYLADSRLYWVAAIVTNEIAKDHLSFVEPFLDAFYIVDRSR